MNKVAYSTLKFNKDKSTLDEYDLYDRVINLKFYMNNKKESDTTLKYETFVLRSDYEIKYFSDSVANLFGNKKISPYYTVQKCVIKPSIKVQYTQVSGGTSIGIDLYINNFFVQTKDGKSLMSFSDGGYKIEKIEIAMGYLGQFNASLGIVKGDLSNITADQLNDFSLFGHGITKITVSNVEYVTTDKLPPDSIIHVHGYVGSTIQTARTNSVPVKYQSVSTSSIEYKPKAKSTPYESLFYQYITRRYVNNARITTDVQPVIAFDTAGYMTTTQSDLYGTVVHCSDGVKELTLPELKDADGKVITSDTLYLCAGGENNTVNSAIQKICEYSKQALNVRRLNDGNFLVFLTSETSTEADGNSSAIEKLAENFESLYADSQLSTEYNNCLPAVYNINIDALSTIVCPFFTWIEPFQTIKFASRYALSSLVSFYASYTPTINEFIPLNIQVSFATVEDVNEMQIMAVAKGFRS